MYVPSRLLKNRRAPNWKSLRSLYLIYRSTYLIFSLVRRGCVGPSILQDDNVLADGDVNGMDAQQVVERISGIRREEEPWALDGGIAGMPDHSGHHTASLQGKLMAVTVHDI